MTCTRTRRFAVGSLLRRDAGDHRDRGGRRRDRSKSRNLTSWLGDNTWASAERPQRLTSKSLMGMHAAVYGWLARRTYNPRGKQPINGINHASIN